MSNLPVPKWPKLPSGVTDWEKVFDDPEYGLISKIKDANSISELRTATILAIKLLYTRKTDPQTVDDCVSEIFGMLTNQVPDTALPKLSMYMEKILRNIQSERLAKARAFEKKQTGRSPGAYDHRTPEKSKKTSRIRITWEALLSPISSKWVSHAKSACVIMLGLGIVLVLALATDKDNPEISNAKTFINQVSQPSPPPGKHIYGGTLRVLNISGHQTVTAFGVPQHECENVVWTLANRGTIVVNEIMPRRISPTIIRKLCARHGEYAQIAWSPRKTK